MTDENKTNLIAEYLATREQRCPICKYNLRNCTSPNCPECGAGLTLVLQVGSAPSHNDGWWLAGVIGLATAIIVLAVLLIALLDAVGAVVRNPALPKLVAGGYASQSELPHWAAILRLALFMSMVTLALGLMTMSRLRLRAARRWARITIGCIAAAAPVISLLALWVIFGG